MVICAWIGCSNRSDKGNKGISFFQFPKEKTLRKQWEVNTKRKFPPHDSSVRHLCELHFHASQFQQRGELEFTASIGLASSSKTRRMLKPGAVPKKYVHGMDEAKTRSAVQKREHIKTLSEIGLEGGSVPKKKKPMTLHHDTQEDEVLPELQLRQTSAEPTTVGEETSLEEVLSDLGLESFLTPVTVTYRSQPVQQSQLAKHAPQGLIPLPGWAGEHNYCMTSATNCKMTQTTMFKHSTKSVQTSTTAMYEVACQTVSADFKSTMVSTGCQCDNSDTSSHEDSLTSDEGEDTSYIEDPNYPSPSKKPRSQNSTDHLLHESRKFIVYESCLDKLFVCPKCQIQMSTTKKTSGTYLYVLGQCGKGHSIEWCSQPLHSNLPLGNLELAGALFFSGSRFAAQQRFFEAAGICIFSESYYFRLQRGYLEPSVEKVWRDEQEKLFVSLQGKQLIVGGDARCDSPGHSAKYGSYTIMDLATNKILDVQLVQSNEVTSSNAMELEGLKRGLQNLKENGVTITDIVTDRHTQVKAYLKKQHDIHHWFDVWHMAKGIKKKLLAASKKKHCTEIADWIKSINQHIYWCVASSGGDGKLVIAKWTSVVSHITNVHCHQNELFPACLHGPMQDTDRAWIKEGSRAHNAMKDVLLARTLLSDIGQGSHHGQTSTLEAFHKVLAGFAPKYYHFFLSEHEMQNLAGCNSLK